MYGSLVLSFSSFTEEINRLSPFFTYLGSEDSAKQFYFPVIYGGEFIYIYRIYEDTFYFEENREREYNPYSDSQNKQ